MKTRILKTGIYTDEYLLQETPDVRFICVYLYTNSHISLNKIYKVHLRVMQLETGYDTSTLKLVLDRLQNAKIIKHHDYLWFELLRTDFGSLIYSGEKNEKAVNDYMSEIPNEIKEYFDSDTSIDSSIYTTDKSEIIIHKSKTINNKLKFGEFEKVTLTDDEYQKLIERLGEGETKQQIRQLDEYIASKGKKYSSHYATILAWSRRKLDNPNQKKMYVI